MTARMLRGAAGLAAAVWIAGCGGGGGGGTEPVDLLAAFCAREAEASCRRAAACYPTAPLDEAGCRAAREATCAPRFDTLRRAVRAGRLAWDAAAAEACLRRMEQGGCAEHSASCLDLFAAAAAPGAACDPAVALDVDDRWFTVEQCAAGACPVACGAACPEPVALGELCGEAQLCAGAAYCSGATGRCTALTPAGGDCLGSGSSCAAGHFCAGPTGIPCLHGEDASCSCAALLEDEAACGADNVRASSPCRSGACEGGSCRRIGGALGAACLRASDCPEGSACFVQEAGDLLGACYALSGAGGPCVSAFQCQEGLACRTSRKCGAPGGAGAACSPGTTWLTDCGAGLACVGGRCAARPSSVGAPCLPSLPCLGADLACDLDLGTCQRQGAASCGTAYDCPSADQACEDGGCVSSGGAGASCLSGWGSWACASGVCAVYGSDGLGTCLDPAACD